MAQSDEGGINLIRITFTERERALMQLALDILTTIGASVNTSDPLDTDGLQQDINALKRVRPEEVFVLMKKVSLDQMIEDGLGDLQIDDPDFIERVEQAPLRPRRPF